MVAMRRFRLQAALISFTLFSLLLSSPARAFLVVDAAVGYAVLYQEKGNAVYQACGSLQPLLATPEAPLAQVLSSCQQASRQAKPFPFAFSRYLSSLYALSGIPTRLHGEGSERTVERIALLGEVEFRTGKPVTAEEAAYFPRALELHAELLGTMEPAHFGLYVGEGTPYSRYNANLINAFSPTFSDGEAAFKIGTAVVPTALDSSCSPNWIPLSLQSLLEMGATGRLRALKLLEWMKREVWESNAAAVSLLTWQNWMEQKQTFDKRVGYLKQRGTFTLTLSEESLRWMEANETTLLEKMREDLFNPQQPLAQGKPFVGAHANTKLNPICIRRLYPSTDGAREASAKSQIKLDEALSRYGVNKAEFRRVVSLRPAAEKALARMVFFDEPVPAKVFYDQDLDPLFGHTLPLFEDVDRQARADWAAEQERKAAAERQAKLDREAEVRRQQEYARQEQARRQREAAEAARRKQEDANRAWYANRRATLNQELNQINTFMNGYDGRVRLTALAGLVGIAGNRTDIGQQAVTQLNQLESNLKYYQQRRRTIQNELDSMPY